MKAPRVTVSLVALVAANLYPLIGIAFLGWNPAAIVLLYWTETVIICLIEIPKIATCQCSPESLQEAQNFARAAFVCTVNDRVVPVNVRTKWGVIKWFCMSYLVVCLVCGFFLVAGIAIFRQEPGPAEQLLDLGPGIAPFNQLPIAILCLVASHGVSFVENFLVRRERERLTLLQLYKQPVPRLIILNVISVLSVFVGLHGMVKIILVRKTVTDLCLHWRLHPPPVEEAQ